MKTVNSFPGMSNSSAVSAGPYIPSTKRLQGGLTRKIKHRALAGRIADLSGVSSKSLEQFQEEYSTWAEHGVESKSTRRANLLALSKLVFAAGPVIMLDALGQKHIDRMVANCRKAGNKTASINNYIRHLKAVMRKAEDWDYVKISPFEKVRQLAQKRRLPTFIQKADISRILGGITDVDLRRYVTAYIATGRRRSELVGLDWMDVSLGPGRYAVRRSKSHLERSYKINDLFRSVLESIGPKDKGPVFSRWRHPDTVTYRVKEALVAAGYGHLNLHSLRHTYASMKAAEGRTLLEIQHLLGHSDIKATAIYSHLTDDHIDDIGEMYIGPVDLGS